jgi:hypothetical protein
MKLENEKQQNTTLSEQLHNPTEPGVSCWYKIFDFVEFSHYISAPCQLLV